LPQDNGWQNQWMVYTIVGGTVSIFECGVGELGKNKKKGLQGCRQEEESGYQKRQEHQGERKEIIQEL